MAAEASDEAVATATERPGVMPGAAVVIAVRDGERYIGEAVRSALDQADGTVGGLIEVIVVDDGSSDGTVEILAAIADPRLRVIRNPGRGVSDARNAGVAASRASWLLFLDADDRLAPGALAALLSASRPDVSGVYGDYERIDGVGHAFGRRRLLHGRRAKPTGSVLSEMLSGNFLINGGVLLCARTAFVRAGGFDPALSLCEDWHLWCRLAALGPFVYLPQRVMDYRVHQTSVMMHKQRRYTEFELALRAIFTDPLIVGRLAPDSLRTLRRRGEVSLMTYCAQQAVRSRALREARSLTVAAISHHPRRAPWVMARIAGAMAGL